MKESQYKIKNSDFSQTDRLAELFQKELDEDSSYDQITILERMENLGPAISKWLKRRYDLKKRVLILTEERYELMEEDDEKLKKFDEYYKSMSGSNAQKDKEPINYSKARVKFLEKHNAKIRDMRVEIELFKDLAEFSEYAANTLNYTTSKQLTNSVNLKQVESIG